MSVLKEDADVIGFQDASARQAKDISNGLKRKYACHCIEAGRKAEVCLRLRIEIDVGEADACALHA